MLKTTVKKKLQSYYALVSIQTVIQFEAESDKAREIAEKISGDLVVDMCDQAPDQYKANDIQIENLKIDEISTN